jgi:hypothetical protein
MRRMSTDLVWYAAYGSNLSARRFDCYLAGGQPPGSRRFHTPCADPSPPRGTAAATLPHRLYFAGESPTWGGGVAFVDLEPAPGVETLVRLYLLTRIQFAAVVAGENHTGEVRLPSPRAAAPRWYVAAAGRYGAVLHCGQRDGVPVLTCTMPPRPDTPLAPPVPDYLRTVATGLAEAHGLTAPQAARYLRDVPGVAQGYAEDDLHRALR